jgi:type I restriction-modification system DNA methylase subunit
VENLLGRLKRQIRLRI